MLQKVLRSRALLSTLPPAGTAAAADALRNEICDGSRRDVLRRRAVVRGRRGRE